MLSEIIVTKLKFLKGYSFKAKFDLEEVPELVLDEPKPIGEGLGPSAPRLLSAALGYCLSTSLIYCLRKARVDVKNLETTVGTSISRNEQGYQRVKNIDVQLHLYVDEKDKARVHRCLEIFENYCTVTQSVRKGIEVKVNVAQ